MSPFASLRSAIAQLCHSLLLHSLDGQQVSNGRFKVVAVQLESLFALFRLEKQNERKGKKHWMNNGDT